MSANAILIGLGLAAAGFGGRYILRNLKPLKRTLEKALPATSKYYRLTKAILVVVSFSRKIETQYRLVKLAVKHSCVKNGRWTEVEAISEKCCCLPQKLMS